MAELALLLAAGLVVGGVDGFGLWGASSAEVDAQHDERADGEEPDHGSDAAEDHAASAETIEGHH
jgi:hypothetical protein